MLVPGDLGFPGLVFVVLFFVGPIFSFAIRWKWRKAEARKKEIRRLMTMASEEAARAELEAAAELGAVSVVRQSECVICYCPTTTRCARCKAVRYCSGKCQIIHWRQGHKYKCHPPQFNGLGSNSNQQVASEGEKQELHGNNLESELNAKSTETFNEDREPASSKSYFCPELLSAKGDDKVAHFAEAEGEGIISGSLSATTMSLFTTSVTTNQSAVGVVPVSINIDRLEKPKSDDIDLEESETIADVNKSEQTKAPHPGFISSDASVDSSRLSNLKQTSPSSNVELINCSSATSSDSSTNVSDESKISEPSMANSDFWDGTLDSNGFGNEIHGDSSPSSLSEGGDGISADSKSSLHFSFDLSYHVPKSHSQYLEPKNCISGNGSSMISGEKLTSYGASQSERMPTNAYVDKDLWNSNSETSAPLGNGSIGSLPLKPKRTRSLSCSASEYSTFSTSGGHSVSAMNSSVVEGARKVRPASYEIASIVPDASNGLSTSVRKVVQQFKAYKLSKHYPIENAMKYNNKMLFSYDLFIKLYHWNKVELRPCGLINCGNSCYANSVLQCLAFTRPLTAYLLQGLHSKACLKKEWCFTCEFESLVLKAKEEKSPLSPVGILSNLESIGSHLGRGREEDAHEFLRYAIDTMQSVCLKEAGETVVGPLAEETTLIGLIFGGYLRSKIKCMKCHGKSERQERMMDLTVEIQGDIETLEEALARFTATEILDGVNKYYCSRCKTYEKGKKKLTVLEAPNILTIALKRFQSGKFGKLNKSVKFPEILNLAPYISGTNDKSPIYRLYAVVVHLDVMNAAFSGHYVCYVRNIQGKWFKIDDSAVKPVELETVLSKGAYMLLYARCSPRAPSLIRNSILCYDAKSKGSRRCLEASHSGKSALPRARPSVIVPNTGPSSVHRRPEDLRSFDGPYGFESLESFDRMFHSIQRIPKVDASSDNSSLFSYSDEGSCSTESTRDSSSTDDISDYIFGEAGRTLNSPLRDFDVSSSPLFSRSTQFAVSEVHPPDSPETSGYPRRIDQLTEADGNWTGESQESGPGESLQDKGSLPFLYSDTSKHCRKLTNCRNSSSRETDIQRLENCKPLDIKSSVHLRRSTRD